MEKKEREEHTLVENVAADALYMYVSSSGTKSCWSTMGAMVVTTVSETMACSFHASFLGLLRIIIEP